MRRLQRALELQSLLHHILPNYGADLFAPLFNLKLQPQSWWKQWLSPKCGPGWGIQLSLLRIGKEIMFERCREVNGHKKKTNKKNPFCCGELSASSVRLLNPFSITSGELSCFRLLLQLTCWKCNTSTLVFKVQNKYLPIGINKPSWSWTRTPFL